MKKAGILHPQLARALAELGHGDFLVIADAGLPIPLGVERVDLAFAAGKPGFIDVLEAVLGEMEVERAVLASELETASGGLYPQVRGRLEDLSKARLEFVLHEDFKALTARARVAVRTGEFTPYANVILESGVVF